MGQFDSLIPNGTTKAPSVTSSTNQFAGLIPKTVASPVQTAPTTPDPFNSLQSKQNTGGVAAQAAKTAFQNTPITPKDGNVIKATGDAFLGAIKQSGENIANYTDTVNQKGLFSVAGATAEGQIAVSLVSGLFGAALSPLQGVARIPGVGSGVDLINKLFSAIGEGSGTVATTMLDTTSLPQSTKDTLRPLVHDTASLVAQIAAGKLGGDSFSVLKDKTSSIMETLHNGLQEAKTEAVKLPVKSETPTDVPVTLKTEEGNVINNQPEPYTPPEQLPTIQMGAAEKSTLPTIQAEVSKTNNLGDGLKLVPEPQIKTPTTPSVSKVELPTPPSTEVKPTGRTSQTLKPIEGTGDLKTRGLSQNIEASAIEKQLSDNFGDLPEYRQVSMADQARQSVELIAQDRELAKQIALGNKAAPKGLLPESVLVAVEHDATVRGDVEALRELANSKLASTATTMGQRIRTLRERDSASPIEAIRRVQQAREEALASRGVKMKEQTVTRIKESIKKTNTKKNWADFVESITC